MTANHGSFVIPQKQSGLYRVRFALCAGDVDAVVARRLTVIAARYGAGELRSTGRQELEIPFVGEADIEAVLSELRRLGLCGPGVRSHPNVVACPGADLCSVALVSTKKTCNDLDAFLRGASENGPLPHDFRVAVSGCPNECSQAGINDVGFVGAVGSYGGRRVPGFELVVGGSVNGPGRLAERIAFISPEDVVPTLRDLLDLYNEFASNGACFSNFFFEIGAEELSGLLLEKLRQRMWFFQI